MSHFVDSARHSLKILLPLYKERVLLENQSDKPGAVSWRGGNLDTLQTFQLARDTLRVIGVRGDYVKTTGSFAVEAHVLRIGLGHHHDVKALLDKQPDGISVIVKITCSETLIRRVDERDLMTGLHRFGDLLPLHRRGVYSRRIVPASLQQYNAALSRRVDPRQKSFDVKGCGLRIVVRIESSGQGQVPEDR